MRARGGDGILLSVVLVECGEHRLGSGVDAPQGDALSFAA
jgi:hypothetical protein